MYSGGGVFLQCVLFHWLAYHSLPLSSLWHNPVSFWAFYLPKLSISLLFATPVFLFRRKYWTIYVSALLNIWILAEVIYFKANRIFIDANTLMLLDYLSGFESSIGMYLTPDLLLLLIPLCLTIAAVFLFDNRRCEWRTFAVVLLCGVLLNGVSGKVVNLAWTQEGSTGTSAVHMLLNTAKSVVCKPWNSKAYQMTDIDQADLCPFVQPSGTTIPTHPLVLVLVESLETWAIRPDVMPNFYHFIQSHHTLYAGRVASQTKGGTSSDGQLIYNTGLLPLQSGAVCQRYPNNVYPSLSEIYRNTALVFPGNLSVWNQACMDVSYHIDSAFECLSIRDHEVFHVFDSITAAPHFDYILAITMASHSPFKACSHYSSLSLPEDMPENMRNYLLCLNYTDSCWGSFLQRIDTDSVLHNSVVCFMGDHIIFDPIMRGEFQDYCDKKGLDFHPREAYTAFVAYSPDLQTSTLVTEPTYQMDAYPTILHLIGAEDYYWRGFGVNLTDTAALHHRPITEQEAYMLSDKLIRANYFKDYKAE